MKSFPLPMKPEDFMPSLVERFNSGDAMNQMALYASDAVFVMNDGEPITDWAVLTARLDRDTKLGIPLVTNVRHIFVSAGVAQIVADGTIEGTGSDGKHVNISGAACDIIRRKTDGI